MPGGGGRNLEDIERSVIDSLEQSNSFSFSQGEVHDGDPGSFVKSRRE